MPRAFKRPAKTFGGVVVVVVVVAATPNYLRQASPDRGKYSGALPQRVPPQPPSNPTPRPPSCKLHRGQ